MSESADNEFRIFGPPGTGKTTYLTRQVGLAANKFGADKVIVTSFTKAAAAELAGRDLPLPRSALGTLHAHCYRSLGQPTIAESKASEWNEQYRDTGWTISGSKNLLDEGIEERDGSDGDKHLELYSRERNRGLNKAQICALNPMSETFITAWEHWKEETGYLDFTDLLERCLEDTHFAPGRPEVIFVDEAQDHTRLQLQLVRKWGRHCDHFVVSGDDDQCIYTFTGATPAAFLDPPSPPDRKRVLSQSYRVPRAVHEFSQTWIGQVSRREDKAYQPRAAEGLVRKGWGTWEDPRPALFDAKQYVDSGKRVMFLAACSYMLQPLIRELRSRGIAYYNPYRVSRGDWNPLRIGENTTAYKIMAFLAPHPVMGSRERPWTVGDLKRWSSLVSAEDIFVRGAKTAIKEAEPKTQVTMDHLRQWIAPPALRTIVSLMAEDHGEYLAWLQRHALKGSQEVVKYVVAAARRSVDQLVNPPQVIVGTIHSVKGGEADVVYLFPDLSPQGYESWQSSGESRDSVVRQFYVGITRAKEALIICQPRTMSAVAVAMSI